MAQQPIVTSTNTPPFQQADAAAATSASNDRQSLLREICTFVIAGVIALCFVGMLIAAYNHSSKADVDSGAYGRAKDLLEVTLSLFGVVAGYYFGRVPAEKQADAARQTANVANQLAASEHNSKIEQNAAQQKKLALIKTDIQGLIDAHVSAAPAQQSLLGASAPNMVAELVRIQSKI